MSSLPVAGRGYTLITLKDLVDLTDGDIKPLESCGSYRVCVKLRCLNSVTSQGSVLSVQMVSESLKKFNIFNCFGKIL